MITNEPDFTFIRHIFLIQEHQMASRIARKINLGPQDVVDNLLARAHIRKKKKYDDNLIIHYTHEKRLQPIKRDIHQLWDHTFKQTPVIDLQLIIGNRNSSILTR